MDLLWTGGDEMVALAAKPLDGGKSEHDYRTMGHRCIHDGASANFIARELGITPWTTWSTALVKLEIDLRSHFLEANSRNDIPLERSHGLDVSDFHTRSRPFPQGVCHL